MERSNQIVVQSYHSATRKRAFGTERMVVGERLYNRTIGSIVKLKGRNERHPIFRIEVLDDAGRGLLCFCDDGTWDFI